MKILQVIPVFCFGGAEIMCENLCYALGDLGHTVVAVSLYEGRTPISQRMEEKGIAIRYLDKKPGLDFSMVEKLRKLMLAEKPDVVHSHLNCIKYAALAAKLAGVPRCVHTLHTLAEKDAEGRVEKMINGYYFRHHWSIPVALSPQVRQSVADFYRIPHAPVVYNGIDLEKYQPKQSYCLGEKVEILHIGRFDLPKNHPGLLKAFRILHDQNPNLYLTLLGDGESMEAMRQLSEQLQIAPWVRFAGMQKDVRPYFARADIFVLPSLYEGIPMTIIEAMASAMPIVASRVGGIPDLLRDGETALLTSPEPEAIARSIHRLLQDAALRQRLGQQARIDSGNFSARHMAQAYIDCYGK